TGRDKTNPKSIETKQTKEDRPEEGDDRANKAQRKTVTPKQQFHSIRPTRQQPHADPESAAEERDEYTEQGMEEWWHENSVPLSSAPSHCSHEGPSKQDKDYYGEQQQAGEPRIVQLRQSTRRDSRMQFHIRMPEQVVRRLVIEMAHERQ